MKPIALTDDQLDIITRAATPLHYLDRRPFLELVAERLRGIDVLGDGTAPALPGKRSANSGGHRSLSRSGCRAGGTALRRGSTRCRSAPSRSR
jgi:hypothetical protein